MAFRCIDAAAPAGTEILVLANGAEAIEVVASLEIPRHATVHRSDPALELVQNFNRCLELARGDIIHIHHSDDAVDQEFYSAIIGLAELFPEAGIYATAAAPVESDRAFPEEASQTLLTGVGAARFILEDPRHASGNVVFRRSVIDRLGAFRPEFFDCPDEEAYLRYAAYGGLALDDRPYYRFHSRPEAYRHRSWVTPGFSARYVCSRAMGLAEIAPAEASQFDSSTIARTVSVAISISLNGHRKAGLAVLRDLCVALPPARRSRRVMAAIIVCGIPGASSIAAWRRRRRSRSLMVAGILGG